MTKEVEALREEVAELRKQMSAMAVAMAELAAKTPYPQIYYYPYTPVPAANPWPWQQYPSITYGIGGSDTVCSASAYEGGTLMNLAPQVPDDGLTHYYSTHNTLAAA